MAIIECRDIGKVYPGFETKALSAVEFQAEAGSFITITGKSGSGKTTLMNLLTGIDKPTSGDIIVAGQRLGALDEKALSRWRGRTMGVVFQFFQLLPTLTVTENILLPMEFCRVGRPADQRRRVRELLEELGIADQADKLPSALSGGQQQRAAIARALANDPPILAADEPTGNLDSQTSETVLSIFSSLAARGKTIVMITHESEYERYATHSIRLQDGRVVENREVSRG